MQDRWVSYIYRYKDEKRWENAGYIKISRTSRGGLEQTKVDIGVKLCKPVMCRCRIYMIYNQRELVFLDELLVPPEHKDTLSFKKTFSWRDFIKSGLTPKDYDGIFFAVDDGDCLMSLWKDKDIRISELVTGDSSPKIGLIPIPEYLKEAEKSEEPAEATVKEVADDIDPIEQLMREKVKLPVFVDSPFNECVKLVPQDIGRLPMSNWKLGQNSFLTHGYYRYKYIMLGKIKFDNRDIFVIGVPGVFTNKERYLANMFGFSLFMPVKKSDTKTGCFGYWVWEVMRQ